jgi:hypothetical protein
VNAFVEAVTKDHYGFLLALLKMMVIFRSAIRIDKGTFLYAHGLSARSQSHCFAANNWNPAWKVPLVTTSVFSMPMPSDEVTKPFWMFWFRKHSRRENSSVLVPKGQTLDARQEQSLQELDTANTVLKEMKYRARSPHACEDGRKNINTQCVGSPTTFH